MKDHTWWLVDRICDCKPQYSWLKGHFNKSWWSQWKRTMLKMETIYLSAWCALEYELWSILCSFVFWFVVDINDVRSCLFLCRAADVTPIKLEKREKCTRVLYFNMFLSFSCFLSNFLSFLLPEPTRSSLKNNFSLIIAGLLFWKRLARANFRSSSPVWRRMRVSQCVEEHVQYR